MAGATGPVLDACSSRFRGIASSPPRPSSQTVPRFDLLPAACRDLPLILIGSGDDPTFVGKPNLRSAAAATRRRTGRTIGALKHRLPAVAESRWGPAP